MKDREFRIITNSSGKLFKIQEKKYYLKDKIFNFILLLLIGDKNMFKKYHHWETTPFLRSFKSLDDAKNEIKRLEQTYKDFDETTWSVIEDES